MNPLTIYRKHPSAPDTYYIGGAWTPACITAVDKRFSDSELAAEYWLLSSRRQRMLAYNDGPGSATHKQAIRDRERMDTIHRMITNPAHDENPA